MTNRKSNMNNPEITRNDQQEHASTRFNKRVILSMGGKGGVGKTSIMAGLAEWFDANRIPVQLLDLDSENKARGSLTHFFGFRVGENIYLHPGGT